MLAQVHWIILTDTTFDFNNVKININIMLMEPYFKVLPLKHNTICNLKYVGKKTPVKNKQKISLCQHINNTSGLICMAFCSINISVV